MYMQIHVPSYKRLKIEISLWPGSCPPTPLDTLLCPQTPTLNKILKETLYTTAKVFSYCGRSNNGDSECICFLDELLSLILRNTLCNNGHRTKLWEGERWRVLQALFPSYMEHMYIQYMYTRKGACVHYTHTCTTNYNSYKTATVYDYRVPYMYTCTCTSTYMYMIKINEPQLPWL